MVESAEGVSHSGLESISGRTLAKDGVGWRNAWERLWLNQHGVCRTLVLKAFLGEGLGRTEFAGEGLGKRWSRI